MGFLNLLIKIVKSFNRLLDIILDPKSLKKRREKRVMLILYRGVGVPLSSFHSSVSTRVKIQMEI